MFQTIQRMKQRDERGFTLVELLVVVAIIAILAAIAIPQFAAYRMKAYNSAAASDVRNAKTAEEALFADNQIYGNSANATINAAPGGAGGAGARLDGPMAAAVAAIAGGLISGTNPASGAVAAMGIGVSSRVSLQADTVAGNASYIVAARHDLGNTAYAVDADNTAMFFCTNAAWAGTATSISATVPAATVNNDFGTAAAPVACGGAPNGNWTAQ